MARATAIIFGLLPSVLAVVSLIFVAVATSSREWAQKSYYPPDLSEFNWTKPIYTIYRSPLIVCGATLNHTVNLPSNSSTSDVGSDRGSDPVALDTYTISCTRFRPFGFNRTSCETLVATRDDTLATYHDRRVCQQIHFSANLAIASCVFIGLGMLFAFALSILTIRRSSKGATTNATALVPGLNCALLFFLLLGAIMLILAQAYAVLGLVQSMPDNGAFASTGVLVTDAEPWVQGKALSVFASVAWLAALLASGFAATTWRVQMPGGWANI